MSYCFNDVRFADWATVLHDSAALARKRAHAGYVCPLCHKKLKEGNGDGYVVWAHVGSLVPDKLHGDESWWERMRE